MTADSLPSSLSSNTEKRGLAGFKEGWVGKMTSRNTSCKILIINCIQLSFVIESYYGPLLAMYIIIINIIITIATFAIDLITERT